MSYNFYILIILFLFSFIYSDEITDDEDINSSEEEDCETIEKCHACNFDELRTIDECQVTGYKKKIQCKGKNNEEEKFNIKSCNENTKINSVYIFLIICIIIFICSYRYHKSQKDSSLQNLLVKLSILKN